MKILSRKEKEISFEHSCIGFCAKMAPSKSGLKYKDGSPVISMHTCPLRYKSYDDGRYSLYSCRINGQEASEGCICGVDNLVQDYEGKKLVQEWRIE